MAGRSWISARGWVSGRSCMSGRKWIVDVGREAAACRQELDGG